MPIFSSLVFCIEWLHKCFAWNHVVPRAWWTCIVFSGNTYLPLLLAEPSSWGPLLPKELVWIICLRSRALSSWCKGAFQSSATNSSSWLFLQGALRIIYVITWSWCLVSTWLMLCLYVICWSVQSGVVDIIGAYAWYAGTLFTFVFYLEMTKSVANCGLWGILQEGSCRRAVTLWSWRFHSLQLNIGALWLRSSCVERATWNYWIPSSEPFNWYYFVVSWTWTQALPELSLFCTYWSDILRKGDAYACFVTNRLYCRVVVKRAWRWITWNGFFTIISNRKFWGISLVRTWAILPKTFPVTIVFLWSWHLRCVTQETLPLLSAHRSICILLQMPDMINIIGSWSIIYSIWKDRRPIGIKFNCNRLLSSTNWSSKIELVWSSARTLRYFGIDIAISLVFFLDMVLRPFLQLRSNVIMSWSWSILPIWDSSFGVDRLHSTSWVISAFHSSMTTTSVTRSGE